MTKDVLKDLPSFSEKNFSQFNHESSSGHSALPKASQQRVRQREAVGSPNRALPVKIVTDQQPILLRYLHNKWKKNHSMVGVKRQLSGRPRSVRLADSRRSERPDGEGEEEKDEEEEDVSSVAGGQPSRKVPRTT